MKLVLLAGALAAMAVLAGYLGLAQQIADGFRLVFLVVSALFILGALAGGIRISGARRLPNLAARVRRRAA